MKRTPLKRGAPIARKTRLRPSNPKRRREAFERNFGQRGEVVRSMPCLLAVTGECRGLVQAAHAKSRGAGGGRRELVPLCAGHHETSHRIGAKTFAARYHVDLRHEADRIAAQLDAGGIP